MLTFEHRAMQSRYYIKDIVYGANDGIITTFAVVSGVIGAGLSVRTVLIIGTASLAADAFSMASSSYLGSASERAAFPRARDEGIVERHTNPLTSALITCISFAAAGSVPLLPYVVFRGEVSVFFFTAVVTGVALFLAGALRSHFTHRGFLLSGAEMLVVGGIAAGIAFTLGKAVSILT